MLPAIANAEPIEAPEIPSYVTAAPESRVQRIARELVTSAPMAGPEAVAKNFAYVDLPVRIPAPCVVKSAQDYRLNPLVLLAVLKVESNGRTGIVVRNTNGTFDLGPAQFNTATWAALLEKRYHIPRSLLVNDMCQAVRAMAFAVRTEINQANGDFWQGIGNYHSKTAVHHRRYVSAVNAAYHAMIKKGSF